MPPTDSPATACRICARSAEGARRFVAREMMFGTREEFTYFECAQCGCVQILTIPADLSRHYPGHYYSFGPPSWFKRAIKGAWLCDPLSAGGALKRAMSALPGVDLAPRWMRQLRAPKTASILDIGTGGGNRLLAMRAAGFRDLTGIDPFIEKDLHYGEGISIYRTETKDLERQFDVVMMHHTFEHLPNPLEALIDAGRVLRDGGTLLVRIPVAGSFAWRTYGVHWVALDPPRHLFLHTPESLELLADQAGFDITDVYYDSGPMQFWGSEQYLRDIPLLDTRSYAVRRYGSIFSRKDLRRFERETARLNAEKQGDAAAFFLRKRG